MRDPRDKDFPITHDGRFFFTVIVCLHSFSFAAVHTQYMYMYVYIPASKILLHVYGLLTKCEVNMAGYWPSPFFLRVYGPRRSPKGFIITI